MEVQYIYIYILYVLVGYVLHTIQQKIGESAECWADEKKLEELKEDAHNELANNMNSEPMGFFFENRIELPI